MEFQATMEDCTDTDGKTVLRGTQLLWSPGDHIKVFGRQGSAIYSTRANTSTGRTSFRRTGAVGTGPFDGPYTAFYPADIAFDGQHVTLPRVQHSDDGSLAQFPMYAQTTTDVLHFKNLCGVLRISLTKPNVNVKGIMIEAETDINGLFSLSFDSHNQIPILSADVYYNTHKTWLVCDEAQSITQGKDFYIYLPEGEYRNLKILICTDDHRYCEKTAKRNVVINCRRSQTTDIEFNSCDLTFIPSTAVGALNGQFSVSPTKKVCFSPDELVLYENTETWHFGYTGVSGSARSNFGWNIFDGGMDAIENGGNEPNAWRTLSADEWDYLFHSRANGNSKYGLASVGGMWGMVLLPDDFVMPRGLSFVPGWPPDRNGLMDGYFDDPWFHNNNSYTRSQWGRMEANGAIFLRNGAYWSSTAMIGVSIWYYWQTVNSVQHLVYSYFNSRNQHDNQSELSVRLVRDVNNSSIEGDSK